MSDTNVEGVRAAYERWAQGDFRVDLELFDPEVEFVLSADFPDTGTYRGFEAITSYMRQFVEPWERLTITAEELTDAGDSIVAVVLQEGTGRRSGVPASVRYFQLWTFRDGRVIRLENLRDRPPAV